jgi:hypothetical protein
MTSTVKSIHDVSLKGTPFAKDKEHFQTSKKGRQWQNIFKLKWIHK